jgi:hypothetical protein
MFHVPEASRITEGPMSSAPGSGRYGVFLVDSPVPGWQLALICDDGTNAEVPESLGWEHVSVSARSLSGFIKDKVARLIRARTRIPTWPEMVYVKELCWDPDDCVVQYHPPRSSYVNVHPHVLHLWRSRTQAVPLPPLDLV